MRIRSASEADVPAIMAIYRPYVEKSAVSFETVMPDQAAFTQRFQQITAVYPWLVVEDEQGRMLGYAYASRAFARAAYDWVVDLAIYFRMDSDHHGMARPLYETLMALLRLQRVHVAYALITGDNEASLRFHEKLGFCPAGLLRRCGYKQGRWHDVAWLEKTLIDESEAVLPLIPFDQLDQAETARVFAREGA